VISFLLFNLDKLNINSMDLYSVTVSGFVSGPGAESTRGSRCHRLPRVDKSRRLARTVMSRHFNA
jgi:hypothetical protein